MVLLDRNPRCLASAKCDARKGMTPCRQSAMGIHLYFLHARFYNYENKCDIYRPLLIVSSTYVEIDFY